jgi:hypothetical protein
VSCWAARGHGCAVHNSSLIQVPAEARAIVRM